MILVYPGPPQLDVLSCMQGETRFTFRCLPPTADLCGAPCRQCFLARTSTGVLGSDLAPSPDTEPHTRFSKSNPCATAVARIRAACVTGPSPTRIPFVGMLKREASATARDVLRDWSCAPSIRCCVSLSTESGYVRCPTRIRRRKISSVF